MPNRAKFQVVIDAKNNTKRIFAEVNNDFKKSENYAQGFNKKINNNITTMKRYSAVIGTALAASSVVFIKKTLNMADGLAKMSQRVGVSVEDLSTLRHAAELSGTGIETFEKAIAKQSRGLLDAQLGLKEAREAYEILNISIFDSAGKLRSTNDVLLDVANKFSIMEDSGKKTALAMKIFGRSGTELIPMLNQGASGIKAMQQEARNLGIEISTSFAKDAERFNDSMTKLEGSLTGLAYKTLPAMAESLSWLSENFVEGLNKITGATANAKAELEELTRKRYVAAWEITFDSYDKETLKYEAELIKKDLDNLKNDKTVGGFLAWMGIDTESNNLDIAKIKQLEDQLNAINNLIDGEKTIVDDLNNTSIDGEVKLTQEAIKLSKEWEKQASILQNEITKNGLSPQSAKLFDLETKAEALRKKYVSIAGAVALINEHLQSAVEIEFKINPEDITTKEPEGLSGTQTDFSQSPEELQFTDTSAMDMYYDHQIERSIEVTDLEMMNHAIMNGSAQATFGNMSSAMYAFYELSGKKSKEAFIAYKATAIGEAIMSTWAGATRAYKDLPAPLSFITSASIVAAGMANVAKIASTSPGGGGGYGGATYTAPSLPPNYLNNNTNTTNNTTDNSSRAINITINSNGGDVNDRYVRDDLIPALQRALGDGMSFSF